MKIKRDKKSVNYFQKISSNSHQYLHPCPWAGCIIRNCDKSGSILEFNTISEYEEFRKEEKRAMWIYMPLKVFIFNESTLFGVYVCPECPMSTVNDLSPAQQPDNVEKILCLHSRTASMLMEDWRILWEDISILSSIEQISHFQINEDVKYATFSSDATETPLVALQLQGKITLLFCVVKRQESPFCSRCVRRKCHHYSKFQAFRRETFVFMEEEFDDEYQPIPEEDENDFGFQNHYLIPPPEHLRGYLYGYNFEPIVYPFSESPSQQSVWIKRMSGVIDIPPKLIPVYNKDKKCKHGSLYQEDNESLIRESENVCLFTDLGERIFSSEVFARPTVRQCSCLQKYDGHNELIWNLGKVGENHIALYRNIFHL